MTDTIEYFAPGFSSYQEVEDAYGPIYDATALSRIAACPRHHQIKEEERLTPKGGPSAPMVAGIATHEGLEYYYSFPERTEKHESVAIEVARASWRSFDIDRSDISEKHSHLTEDQIVQVMENYFDEWLRHRIEIYEPIAGLTLEDLDLSQVLAARFPLNDDGQIILGESNLVMLFDVDGEQLVYAGKPDLPVVDQAGRAYTMDHKTTSSYLSDWWAQKHEVSSKDRGYMAMLQSLLGKKVHGSVINGIYVGKYATNPDSKATKFERFKFPFSQGHIHEALKNQLTLIKTIKFYQELGYFPQTCGYGGCKHPDICKRDPEAREIVKLRDYEPNTREFWDL